jgi:uncharacterized membrane protein (DUF4010 family)
MEPGLPQTWIGLAVALAAGLLIGIERERRKSQQGEAGFAGVRTFSVAALAGALPQALGLPWLVALAGALLGALIVVAYLRSSARDPGMTTELALFVTFLIGVAAPASPGLATGLAVAVTVLLASRPRLHAFAREVLSTEELRDALILAASALIVLPLMPAQPLAWLGGIAPRAIWGVVVLLLAVQAVGHVALRWLGARQGLAWSGLASGFVTSAGTIAALGLRAREEPAMLRACATGALLSCVATFTQLALLVLALRPGAFGLLAPMLGAALLAVVAVALPGLLRRAPTRATPDGESPPESSSPPPVAARRAFDLGRTVVFSLLLVAVTALTGWASAWLGSGAALAATALAGFADVHAAATSALSLAAAGTLPDASLPALVLAAVTTNSLTKLVATVAGGPAYALRVAPGLIAIAVAAAAGAWIGA